MTTPTSRKHVPRELECERDTVLPTGVPGRPAGMLGFRSGVRARENPADEPPIFGYLRPTLGTRSARAPERVSAGGVRLQPDPICEQDLRPIAAVSHWRRQRAMWAALLEQWPIVPSVSSLDTTSPATSMGSEVSRCTFRGDQRWTLGDLGALTTTWSVPCHSRCGYHRPVDNRVSGVAWKVHLQQQRRSSGRPSGWFS